MNNLATVSQTATNAPTVTPTPLASEPAPQALTGAQYAYDGDGTMMRGTINDQTTFYPGRHYNKEVSPGATKIQKFYFAGTITIAIRTLTDTADTLTWVLGDHLGSASTTANENGTLNSVIQYTAFGEIRLTQGFTPTKYRYTGQLAQAELGLDFYVSRMYDPLTAHFTTADTIIPEPGKSQSWDRYAYVFFNPIRFTDPSGHDVGCAGTDASNCVKKNQPLIRNLGYRKYATIAESEEEFNNLLKSVENHDITDAEFLYRFFTSTTQPGVNPKDRLSYLLDITKSGPYLQFKYTFGDTGFSIEYRDGANQVNHFLEAVRLGSANINTNQFGQYIVESFVIGHELSGDNLFGNGEKNERISNIYQLLLGLDPIKHILYGMDDTGFDTLIINDRNDIYRLDKTNRTGNSVMDIQLSRKGVEFGRVVLQGNFDTINNAASWLLNNICANPISCK